MAGTPRHGTSREDAPASGLVSIAGRGASDERAAIAAAGELDRARPLGVYVHFPFCSARCPYCDFAIDTRPEIPHRDYADAVLAELRARAPHFGAGAGLPRVRLASVYFGGGTPGLWRAEELARVLDAVCAAFVAEASRLEITVEANPGEVGAAHLRALRSAGVNRLSLGVQSLSDAALRAIGRAHDADGARAGIARARAAGFDNLSCDLMFGLPGQTLADWRADLDALVALGPEHVSAYGLTIERGTPFGARVRAGRLAAPDAELQAAMYAEAQERLGAAGYAQYEVSSHARPGRRAVHNSLYWTLDGYLGLGCSAASFRPLCGGEGVRSTNPRATDSYLREVARAAGAGRPPGPARVERRTRQELESEALWLGLRTADGVDRAAHARRFGADPLATPARARAAAACAARGWLEITPARLRPTAVGFRFADEVAVRLWG